MKKFNVSKLNEKLICGRFATGLTAMALMSVQAFAAENAFMGVVAPIVNLLNDLMAPLLAIVVAVGGLYCILLGVKFAKAEEPQEREKAKGHLKNAIIGFVLIFVLIVAMNLMLPVMTQWVDDSVGRGNTVFGG